MQHIVFKDTSLNGWEYGMLRSFEDAIVKRTGATPVEIPPYPFAKKYLHHFGHGMRRGRYRGYFPKHPLLLNTDVAWYILMGPENYRLDLFKGWNAGTKVLYLFDTLPGQYPLIKRLFSDNTWDILITSFNDAVDDLQQITGRKWHCLEQAADSTLFPAVPFDKRAIDFSAYGRRYPLLHEAVKEFCTANHLYYDYTTHDAKHPVVDSPELYRQYAWHLSHSKFTFSWPVELTNPTRAGKLRPITCRWFEAAASGTVMLGRQPDNPAFQQWLGKDMVVDIDPNTPRQQLFAMLETVWAKRESLSDSALEARRQKIAGWTWEDRVARALSWL